MVRGELWLLIRFFFFNIILFIGFRDMRCGHGFGQCVTVGSSGRGHRTTGWRSVPRGCRKARQLGIYGQDDKFTLRHPLVVPACGWLYWLPLTATDAFLLGVSGRVGATSSWCVLGNGNHSEANNAQLFCKMYRTAIHFQGGVTSSTEVDDLCKIYCRKCSVKTTLLSEKQSHVTYKPRRQTLHLALYK